MRKFLALPSVAATGLVLGVSSAHAQTGLDTTCWLLLLLVVP